MTPRDSQQDIDSGTSYRKIGLFVFFLQINYKGKREITENVNDGKLYSDLMPVHFARTYTNRFKNPYIHTLTHTL